VSIISEKPTYILTKIKDIPILDVCDYLGINVNKRGRDYWCKVRPERNPSVILHTDTNTFYDFGNQKHGSSIDLVCYATGKSFEEAVYALGKAFDLAPESETEKRHRFRTMSRTDYLRIGLHSDLATKNFTFPIEHLPLNKLVEIERKYKMSMNDLRSKHPKVYERLIREKAIPFVENQKNLYYFEVWNYYTLLQSFNNTYLFYDSERTLNRFSEQSKALERVERSLVKACLNTSFNPPEPAIYDPIRIITLFEQNRLTISLGNKSFDEIKNQFRDKVASLKLEHETFFDKRMTDELEKIPHAAIISKDKAEIYGGAEDILHVVNVINEISSVKRRDFTDKNIRENDAQKTSLSLQIETAQQKTNTDKKTYIAERER